MRLIDADKLIKAIEDFFEGICVYDVESFEAEHDFESIVDEMETANEWISCSERLPDKDGDYLITYDESYANDYDRLVSIAPFEVASEAFGYWYQHLGTNGWVGEDWINIPVVAWMELPQPYRGDDK